MFTSSVAYNGIDLLDGITSGETAGGYKKHTSTGATGDADAVDVNFILMDRNAAVSVRSTEAMGMVTSRFAKIP